MCALHNLLAMCITCITHSLTLFIICSLAWRFQTVDQLLITMFTKHFVLGFFHSLVARLTFFLFCFVKCRRSLRYYALIMKNRSRLFHFVHITFHIRSLVCSLTLSNSNGHLIGIVWWEITQKRTNAQTTTPKKKFGLNACQPQKRGIYFATMQTCRSNKHYLSSKSQNILLLLFDKRCILCAKRDFFYHFSSSSSSFSSLWSFVWKSTSKI